MYALSRPSRAATRQLGPEGRLPKTQVDDHCGTFDTCACYPRQCNPPTAVTSRARCVTRSPAENQSLHPNQIVDRMSRHGATASNPQRSRTIWEHVHTHDYHTSYGPIPVEITRVSNTDASRLLEARVERRVPPCASNQRLAAKDPFELTTESGSHGARSDVRRFDVELQPGKPYVRHRPVAQ